MRESTIEQYLVDRIKALGGEVRKVQWVGRQKAPDRVVMLPDSKNEPNTYYTRAPVWVELKNPETIKHFPSNAHERAQQREHWRMREMSQLVLVLGTKEQIDKEFPL